MSSSKKRSKDDQIPKPINIKKEKSEEDRTLNPISHYIDDRLELVKQIFGTLKPKTIMNLAPEFLKKTGLDEIEELCLNELVCISTKRLKSIIADTRCPTDTESSEDSDVEQKEEHISLEEISSDSDIGGSETRRAKKLRKSNAKRPDKTNENKETDGQISVLELLELQARARAIRSQLAMEPITKIEVKSDDDDDDDQNGNKQMNKDKTKNKRTHKTSSSTNNLKSGEPTSSEVSAREQLKQRTNGKNAEEVPAGKKKIKLKRNYRNLTKSPEKQTDINEKPAKSMAEIEINEESRKSRSASPDVIPIPAEPETLLISDSTDDEAKPTSENLKKSFVGEPQNISVPAPVPAADSEPEEGEVREESETEAESQNTTKVDTQEKLPVNGTEIVTVQSETPEESTKVTGEESECPSTSKQCEEAIAEQEPEPESHQNISIVEDEDHNDDVISIGGDLEHEMIEELSKVTDEPAVKVESVKQAEPDEEDNDVISLNTSEDEHEKLEETSSESWRTRYLKSSKVNQVLVASRLGKRVRDKIKESKRAQKNHSEGKVVGDVKTLQQQQTFTSKHEDGSMEQYQELLQHRQRKSSNSSKADK